MDLNVQPPAFWSLEDGPYEVANFCLERKTNVLVLLNAWLDSGLDIDDEKDWRTLNYWATRLRPLWARRDELEKEEEEGDDITDTADLQGHETIVIVCNRAGTESGQ